MCSKLKHTHTSYPSENIRCGVSYFFAANAASKELSWVTSCFIYLNDFIIVVNVITFIIECSTIIATTSSREVFSDKSKV